MPSDHLAIYTNLTDGILGQGGNEPNLNADLVRMFPIYVPATEHREEFVGCMAVLEVAYLEIPQFATASETLFASVQHRTLRGKL